MLFGLSARKEIVTNEYLRAFYSHCEEHPHGWGLANLSADEPLTAKESVKASDSALLEELLSSPIESKLMMAHIRYATVGHIEYGNCHPFSGRDASGVQWTLAHNGTIFDYPALSRYLAVQRGDTDSERVLLYLLDRIDVTRAANGGRLGSGDMFSLIEGILSDMSKGNKLNILLSDGRDLYVHSNCRDTLYYLRKDGRVVIATAPLTDEDWRRIPLNTLLALRGGKLLGMGSDHGNEYIEDPEHIKYLYQIFSDL